MSNCDPIPEEPHFPRPGEWLLSDGGTSFYQGMTIIGPSFSANTRLAWKCETKRGASAYARKHGLVGCHPVEAGKDGVR